MIATVLVFLLGLLVALLAALLAAPILWRKAQDFARREFEATVPLSANEIRAEFDAVRAGAALSVRQGEIAADAMRARMAKAQAALGRAEGEVADLRKRISGLETEIAGVAAERDNVRQIFAAHRDKEQALSETLDEVRRDGSLNAQEMEALAVRFREMADLAEERKVELVAAETRIERLTDALRSVERAGSEKDTLIRLLRREGERPAGEAKAAGAPRAGVMPGMMPRAVPRPSPVEQTPAPLPAAGQRLREALARSSSNGALTEGEAAELRERIAVVAANVLHQAALAEGRDSPLASLLEPAETPGAAGLDGYVSLAERVRRLAAENPAPVDDQPASRRAE